jgi:hypothetical protein
MSSAYDVEPYWLHCKLDSISVFPGMKLRSLVPNFHIDVSVSDLHIPTIIPLIVLLQNRWNDRGKCKSLTDT